MNLLPATRSGFFAILNTAVRTSDRSAILSDMQFQLTGIGEVEHANATLVVPEGGANVGCRPPGFDVGDSITPWLLAPTSSQRSSSTKGTRWPPNQFQSLSSSTSLQASTTPWFLTPTWSPQGSSTKDTRPSPTQFQRLSSSTSFQASTTPWLLTPTSSQRSSRTKDTRSSPTEFQSLSSSTSFQASTSVVPSRSSTIRTSVPTPPTSRNRTVTASPSPLFTSPTPSLVTSFVTSLMTSVGPRQPSTVAKILDSTTTSIPSSSTSTPSTSSGGSDVDHTTRRMTPPISTCNRTTPNTATLDARTTTTTTIFTVNTEH